MRRALVSLAGAVGLVTLARALRRRRTPPPAPTQDPADELRAVIAESTADEPPGEPAAEEQPDTIDERRRRIHERAQEAIDAMREPPAS